MNELTHAQKQMLHNEIASRMVDIERLFKPGLMELTFIGRNKSDPKAHILVTSEDDTSNICRAIKELMDQTDATVFPSK